MIINGSVAIAYRPNVVKLGLVGNFNGFTQYRPINVCAFARYADMVPQQYNGPAGIPHISAIVVITVPLPNKLIRSALTGTSPLVNRSPFHNKPSLVAQANTGNRKFEGMRRIRPFSVPPRAPFIFRAVKVPKIFVSFALHCFCK